MKDVLKYAADAYGFNENSITFISESTNKIYSFEQDNKEYILRVAQKPIDSVVNTKAEIEWLYYLSKGGISVSLPLYTLQDELVTCIVGEDGRNYILSAYEKAGGVFWNKSNPALWNADIFYAWGSVMGEIHQLTKNYVPSDSKCKREEFQGDFALASNYKLHPDVKEKADEIIHEIMQLPRDENSYGLIHNDFHPWNFHIDGKTIRVFDFDDCLYSWFAMDIGIALYHGLWWGRPVEPEAAQKFSKELIENFLKVYTVKNQLDSFWLAKIPLFMRYRQLCKFSWFFNLNDINEEQEKRIYNIRNGILFDNCNPDPDYFLI